MTLEDLDIIQIQELIWLPIVSVSTLHLTNTLKHGMGFNKSLF
jgi:hypothetical protein